MISVNERAKRDVLVMMEDAEALGIAVRKLANGATVLDCGIEVAGSLEAGRLYAEVCMGGLAQISFCDLDLGDLWLPGVRVVVSDPPVSCLAAQYAGWEVKLDDYFAMGSGPARALHGSDPIFEHIAYRDASDVGVLTLETRSLPGEAVADKIAAKCGIAPANLYLLVAPTASLVGSVQVAARVVETGLHKMVEIGFDVNVLLSGLGRCPLPPIAADDVKAIGWTNDAVLYGGEAWYAVRTDDEAIEKVIDLLPSCASADYGKSFSDLLERSHGAFYEIDPLLFSPAAVSVNNMRTGRRFRAGSVDVDIVRRVLLG